MLVADPVLESIRRFLVGPKGCEVTGITFTPDQSATWAYDPEIDAWTRAADMPSPRAAHAMAALDGKLYVVGGVGPDPQALWVYDPKTDSWATDLAPLPTAREHLAAVMHDGELYVIGGRREEIGNLATLEVYDPATDSWRRGPDMPTPRGGISAGLIQGRIHVTGGEAFSPRRTFDRHEVYDPRTDSWSTAAALPTARHGLASAVVGGRWYVIGGGEMAGALTIISLTDAVEVFSPAKRAGVRRCCG
jgi:N-acetylneuraminic acid mutarotase